MRTPFLSTTRPAPWATFATTTNSCLALLGRRVPEPSPSGTSRFVNLRRTSRRSDRSVALRALWGAFVLSRGCHALCSARLEWCAAGPVWLSQTSYVLQAIGARPALRPRVSLDDPHHGAPLSAPRTCGVQPVSPRTRATPATHLRLSHVFLGMSAIGDLVLRVAVGFAPVAFTAHPPHCLYPAQPRTSAQELEIYFLRSAARARTVIRPR